MGCFWSSERHIRQRCRECGRRDVNNLLIINDLCEICISGRLQQRAWINKSAAVSKEHNLRPIFGEYYCSCGRTWSSRLSWPNAYQVCKRCRRQVYAHTQRQLRPSDRSKDVAPEHPEELCQKCQTLGHYCGRRLNK